MQDRVEQIHTEIALLVENLKIEHAVSYIDKLESSLLINLLQYSRTQTFQKFSLFDDLLNKSEDILKADELASIRMQLLLKIQAEIIYPLSIELIQGDISNLSLEQNQAYVLYTFKMWTLITQIIFATQQFPDRSALFTMGLLQKDHSFLEQCALLPSEARLEVLQKLAHVLPSALTPSKEQELSQSNFTKLLVLLKPQEQVILIMTLIEIINEDTFTFYFGTLSSRLSSIDNTVLLTSINQSSNWDIIQANPQSFLETRATLSWYRKKLLLCKELDLDDLIANALQFFLDMLRGDTYFCSVEKLSKYQQMITNTPIGHVIQQKPLSQLIENLSLTLKNKEMRLTSESPTPFSLFTPVGSHWATCFSAPCSPFSPVYEYIDGKKYIPIQGLEFFGMSKNEDSLFIAYDNARQPQYSPLNLETLRFITMRQLKTYPNKYSLEALPDQNLVEVKALSDLFRRTIIILQLKENSKALQVKESFNLEYLNKNMPVFVYYAHDKNYAAFRVTGERLVNDILAELEVLNVASHAYGCS